MSDETTPGPDLREQIAEALRTSVDGQIIAEWICCDPVRADHDMCSNGDAARQMARTLLTDDPDWYDEGSPVLDAVMAVVQPGLDRLRERAESAESLAAAAMETVGRLQRDERTTEQLRKQQEDRAEEADATIARVKALAEDMSTWCSPYGIAVTYAQRIEEAINPPEWDDDLPAVREFAAKHDPRHVERPPTITEILDHAAELDRLRRNGGPK